MQDIFTSLVRAESEPSQDAVRHRGNVHGSDFGARTTRIGAVAFYGEYVGAVLTVSSSPADPIQLIDDAPRAGQGASYLAQAKVLLSSATSRIEARPSRPTCSPLGRFGGKEKDEYCKRSLIN